uniref:DUF7083 domain-containing protein n=1 Tax=Heterorhabditis bacteriophora TaxID=37862 RepID=A0A1I7WQN1_HETBA
MDSVTLAKILDQQRELFMIQQAQLLERLERHEQQLVVKLEELQLAAGDGNPRTPKRSVIEQVISSLSKRVPDFTYDPEAGLTFYKWISRFDDVVGQEGSALEPSDRTRLLVGRLDSVTYARFSDYVLPMKPTELTMEEARKILDTLFGEKVTDFRPRYDAFRTCKKTSEDYRTYAATVN